MGINVTNNITYMQIEDHHKCRTNILTYHQEYFVKLSILTILSIPVIFGNLLVILAIYQQQSLRTITNYFIASLAIVDEMIGINSVPVLVVFHNLGTVTETRICIFISIIMYHPFCTSILHLLAIDIDRYIAIIHPLHYHQWVTPFRAQVAIATIWLGGFTMFAVFMVKGQDTDAETYLCDQLDMLLRWKACCFLVTSFAIPLTIMVVLYIRIFLAARTQLRKINNQLQVTDHIQQNSRLQTELKAAITPCIVLGVLLVCWLPQLIMVSIHPLFPGSCDVIGQMVADTLIVINSGINPVIYAWRNRKFRQAFQKIIQKMKQC
ncbi:adrenergic receptor-like protein [Saccoglossus kowalevskii]|uniref:Adrenergic receptor-like protein n=1 Tax=Saccoglossus kowalevskii TaxID=10224 RepID=D2XMQ2_SACKO|nr:adrenergic receptor-like protein [Saccoglossus kowalevskii]ADB22391.1 adrenergic receptor-like protein [Saccoglossus kowalevskii]